ncbi:hypothetical protein VT84_12595 [Gemmata sp. SH-PL17]|uniref:trypsin-like serine peptidase n=1 Tax=Gemmata sp. SH-PL17 TaxID=1630693 RepID=UPI00078B4235|nr:serine protease [Gemmata sp. SH-PL17]AMV25230.1 hypothetical protein VT84_12595 [Gemmata sp. SH-PL17]
MTRTEKVARLVSLVRTIQTESEGASDALRTPVGAPLEDIADLSATRQALEKTFRDPAPELDDDEVAGLEAIVLTRGRPVAFIRDSRYDPLPAPWAHLNADPVRQRLQPLLNSVGRVELPNSSIPYGGTAFVVGPDLLMTNRHVAALFTVGLGTRGLLYNAGNAAIDFRREVGSAATTHVEVSKVVMMHPYWDMALLRVRGLPAAHPALKLSIRPPDELVGRDVIAVGYPALDSRNDIELQNRIFQSTYEVKRLQPGKFRGRESIRSFETRVNAATHDSSTLGGNSGSAVLDPSTGEAVALHFAGAYLKANYAVPTYELARDPRVVAAGLNFSDVVPATNEFDAAWARAGGE